MNDFQFAARTLRKSPAFTAIAVLTLAIGIGANTAVFSLVHAVILKPLPFRSPAQLITVWDAYAPQIEKAGISVAEMAEWQRQTDLLSESAWYRSVPASLALTGVGIDVTEVQATLISPGLLPMLGAASRLSAAESCPAIPQPPRF